MNLKQFYTIQKENQIKYEIRVDQGSEFYNNIFKKNLEENHIEKYSSFNEGKYVATER